MEVPKMIKFHIMSTTMKNELMVGEHMVKNGDMREMVSMCTIGVNIIARWNNIDGGDVLL